MSERLFLVGVLTKYDDRKEKIDLLEELAALGKTAGGEVVEKILQHRDWVDPRFFIGKGKAEELARIGEELNIDTFVFDEELSGVQARNLEEIIGRKIVDRTELILDIFSRHARTMSAKVEIELTQLKYRMTRLTGKGVALSRLGGGIGTMGPGEQKLEIDRRRIRERVQILGRRLEAVERSKVVQSKRRRDFRRVALVGYTNAGKSTIMNKLTHSNVLVEDKLFSTLDSTTRILMAPGLEKILLTDTIGFLRKLPHGLISSFKSTLQEAIEADLRLHVIDVSHPNCESQLMAGNEILEQLGVIDRPTIYVFNKVDRDTSMVPIFSRRHPDAVFISALGEITPLKERVFSFFGLGAEIQQQ